MAEARALEYFRGKGFSLVQRNFKTPFAEVDLLLSGPECFLLVEVKTFPRRFFEECRISHHQRLRLTRAFEYLSRRYDPLRSALVWVAPLDLKVHYDFLVSRY